jgi:hypothetical protein
MTFLLLGGIASGLLQNVNRARFQSTDGKWAVVHTRTCVAAVKETSWTHVTVVVPGVAFGWVQFSLRGTKLERTKWHWVACRTTAVVATVVETPWTSLTIVCRGWDKWSTIVSKDVSFTLTTRHRIANEATAITADRRNTTRSDVATHVTPASCLDAHCHRCWLGMTCPAAALGKEYGCQNQQSNEIHSAPLTAGDERRFVRRQEQQ